jgi:hypothetical protein
MRTCLFSDAVKGNGVEFIPKGRLLQEITQEKRTFCASDEPQILA